MATNFPNGLSSRGVPVENAGSIPMGVNNVYWVDGTNGDDTNTGKTLARAWKTVEKFFANDAQYDVCLVMPGTYTVASGSLPMTPLADTKLIAAIPSPRPNVIITDDAGGSDNELFDAEVDNVTFSGIRFLAAHNDIVNLVKVADTANVVGLTFDNCWFDGVAFTTVNGIGLDDATQTIIGLVVQNCRFEEGLVSSISIGVQGIPQGSIVNNVFENDASEAGINMADVTSASGRGYGYVIKDNVFLGASDIGADSNGIVIAGGDDVAVGAIIGNFFADVGTPVTQDQHDENFGGNFAGGGNGADYADPTSA